MGICPEIKRNPLALIACEYGPIALGALGVETTSRVTLLIEYSVNVEWRSISKLYQRNLTAKDAKDAEGTYGWVFLAMGEHKLTELTRKEFCRIDAISSHKFLLEVIWPVSRPELCPYP